MEYYMCDHAHLYNISEVLASERGKRGGGVNVDHEEAVYRLFFCHTTDIVKPSRETHG